MVIILEYFLFISYGDVVIWQLYPIHIDCFGGTILLTDCLLLNHAEMNKHCLYF